MSSISNISVGATYAGNMAHKARHEMNASIMRLSSGSRTVMGGDAAGQSIGNNLMARAKSHYVAARNAEDGISALLTSEAALNEIANLAYRVRELGVQADNAALLNQSDAITSISFLLSELKNTPVSGRVNAEFNIEKILDDKNLNTILKDGDSILIPEKIDHIYVFGEVSNQGSVAYSKQNSM